MLCSDILASLTDFQLHDKDDFGSIKFTFKTVFYLDNDSAKVNELSFVVNSEINRSH